MTVQWNGAAVLARVKAAAVLGQHRNVEAVREEMTSLILTGPKTGRVYGAHQASAPGEAPASDTGQLVNSITTSVDPNTVDGTVGVGAAHGKALEYGTRNMAPRPFARPALVNKSADCTKNIADEIGKALS